MNPTDYNIPNAQIQANLQRILAQINDCEIRYGRQTGSVKLIAVSKYVDASVARRLVDAGAMCLGENRPQSLWEKSEALQDLNVEWHLIGHLQRNKVRRTVELATLIHSVDSPRLMQAIQDAAKEAGKRTDLLLEVNISGEAAKHGLAPSQVEEMIETAGRMSHIRVQGLMGMAGLFATESDTQRQFESLQALALRFTETSLPENVSMNELSMGMSGDFSMAIKAGSTMVRIGSLLFE